jgi:hypothetical protein
MIALKMSVFFIFTSGLIQITNTSTKTFLTKTKRNERRNISTSNLDSKTRSPPSIKISRVPKKIKNGGFYPPHFKNISTDSSKSSFEPDPISKKNKYNSSETFSSSVISQNHK